MRRHFAWIGILSFAWSVATTAHAQGGGDKTPQPAGEKASDGNDKETASDDSSAADKKDADGKDAKPAGEGKEPAAGGSKASSQPTAAGGAVDGATYSVRLRDLQSRVDELKDQIRRSHTRLALLSDTIVSGGAAGSRAEIVFHNEMSNAFKLTRALVVLDGAVQYNRQDDSGTLADQKEIPIFSGNIPPGDHTVSVLLNFRGNGYGVFTYLRGYKFEVKSAHSFTAVEGKTMVITATAMEKGGVTTPLEQRPAIEWVEKVGTLRGGAPASKPRAKSGGGVSGNVSIGGGKK